MSISRARTLNSSPESFSTDTKPAAQGKLNSNVKLDCVKAALETGEDVTFHVNGMCMHPLLKDRDTIIVRKARLFLPGDLIAYYCSYHQTPVVHRFLGYVRTRGRWKYLTMPDNAKRPDTLVVDTSLLGKGFSVNRVKLSHRFWSLWRYCYYVTHLALTHRLLLIPSQSRQ